MINVCTQCGIYRADKTIDPTGPYAICPECGFKHPFIQLPLLIVSGASAAGKTAVCQLLLGQVTQVVLLDSDILWRPEFNSPETQYRAFFETWLRVCKNISQSGRPVVLFGAGMGVPENMEVCIERRYFTTIHYLALVCSDEILSARLHQRPNWRGSTEPVFLEAQLRFNHWFKTYSGTPEIRRLDTTNTPVDQTVNQVSQWIQENIA
jgi:hypothetical protein